MSKVTKTKSIEHVKSFALIRLSAALYRMHKDKTMIEIAEQAGINASVLSSIKNDSIKSITLARVLRIIDNLNIEYTLNISNRSGVKHYAFEMEGYGHFGASNRKDYVIEPGSKRKDRTSLPSTQLHS